MGGIIDDLEHFIKGTVKYDDKSLADASHDASIFSVRPQVVVAPKDVKDLQNLVYYVSRMSENGQDVTLTARNKGTCMSGGPLTQGIVLDMANMSHVGAADIKHKKITVQGGAMHLDVELATHPHKLLFAPYTSSRDLCGIGGMIGNNASGEQSIKYGPTSANVSKLKVMLSDGNEYEFGPLTIEQLAKKKELPTYEGRLYREVTKLLEDNWNLVQNGHPKVRKNAAGYALWELWDEHRHTFNMARLFIGAQGTLGITTEAELKLVPFAAASQMIVAPVPTLRDLAPIVQEMLAAGATTIETFDYLADGKHLVVFAIYDGDSVAHAKDRVEKIKSTLMGKGYEAAIVDDAETKESYLLIRRKSFKMLLEHPHGNSRAMPFIEDTIVGIAHYGEFLAALEAILANYDMDYTYAGHIGDGSIRLIPLVDMEKPDSADKVMELCQRVYDLTFAFGGSMGVDHNDGILKTPFLERMYGPEMITLFARVKELFDPLGMFNPGKKLGGTLEYAKEHMIRENNK
jgi:FAD/FMN-containing dehydrogenase